MLETSRDLLNIILAFAISWVTIFVCWGLWYMISMLRNFSRITTSLRKKMETVDKILDLVKEKLEKGSNHMALLADSAMKLVGFLIDKKEKNSKSKRSRK